MLSILKSEQDASVNFVDKKDRGFLESRYVRRIKDYFICYLSAQTGCNRGCKFCHLTTTEQTRFDNATPYQILEQAQGVLDYYVQLNDPAKFVHYNFMARGEPLASTYMIHDGDRILSELGALAKAIDLPSKVNISTIMPKTLRTSLVDIFKYSQPNLYYSFYSTDPVWRDKWLPGAMDWHEALRLLKEYQEFTSKQVKIHFAFIEGGNDTKENLHTMLHWIEKYKLDVAFNVVRYNPPDGSSREPDEAKVLELADYIRSAYSVKVIPRVGYDVKASCGMFVK